MGYIYLIRNTANGKGYIGKTERTVARRFADHVGESRSSSSRPISRAIREHGVDNFEVTEIVSFENDHLEELEKGFIALYGTLAPGGYNVNPGGEGARLKTSEVKEMSVMMGSLLDKLRKERGWTQKELAERSGLDQPFTSRIIRGLMKPSLQTLVPFARAFGLTLSELFELLEEGAE